MITNKVAPAALVSPHFRFDTDMLPRFAAALSEACEREGVLSSLGHFIFSMTPARYTKTCSTN